MSHIQSARPFRGRGGQAAETGLGAEVGGGNPAYSRASTHAHQEAAGKGFPLRHEQAVDKTSGGRRLKLLTLASGQSARARKQIPIQNHFNLDGPFICSFVWKQAGASRPLTFLSC